MNWMCLSEHSVGLSFNRRLLSAAVEKRARAQLCGRRYRLTEQQAAFNNSRFDLRFSHLVGAAQNGSLSKSTRRNAIFLWSGSSLSPRSLFLLFPFLFPPSTAYHFHSLVPDTHTRRGLSFLLVCVLLRVTLLCCVIAQSDVLSLSLSLSLSLCPFRMHEIVQTGLSTASVSASNQDTVGASNRASI